MDTQRTHPEALEAVPVSATQPRAEKYGIASIDSLLQRAVDGKLDVEALSKLVELRERVMAKQAERDFALAMAAFQRSVGPIPKTKTARIVTKSGGGYEYAYAPLETIAASISQALNENCLSYSWDSTSDGNFVVATCKVRHISGHVDSATFSAPVDSLASMSGAQKAAAALTFARRQSLVQVFGLTTCDTDLDGAEVEDQETITPEQVDTLEALIDEVGADRRRFIAWLDVQTLDHVRASAFDGAMRALRSKKNS